MKTYINDTCIRKLPSHVQSFQRPCFLSTELQTKTKVTVLKGDILDAQCLKRACQGMSAVIHTAAAIDPLGAASRQTILDVNLKGAVPREDMEQVGK